MRFCTGLGIAALALVMTAPAEAGNRLGVGAHYWRTVDSVGDDIDRDGVSWLVTCQGEVIPLLKLQVDLEVFPDNFAGAGETVYAPQVLGIFGGWIYAGAGIGVMYANSEFSDKPFYLLRAGLDLPILPSLRLDINANYHFSEWKGINETASDIESDTVTLGAALRLEF